MGHVRDPEKLLILNSYAKSVGYNDNNIPFPNVTAPTVSPNTTQEYMGFSYHLPEKLHRVTNPATDVDNEGDDSDEEDVELEPELTEAQADDFVAILGDEFDIEVVVGDEEVPVADPNVKCELQALQVQDETVMADKGVNKDFIEQELARLIPVNADKRKSTLDTFNRLTSDHCWIPFRMPDSPLPATDIDKAEADYFNEQAVQLLDQRQ